MNRPPVIGPPPPPQPPSMPPSKTFDYSSITRIASQWWFIFTTLVAIILVLAIIYIAIKPTPIKYMIKKMRPCAEYTANENAKITRQYTLYEHPDSKHTHLIVVIMGGSGMFSNLQAIYGITNWLYTRIGETHDIVTFKYPTRFKHTIHDTMLSINESLKNFVHYPTVDVVAISFGVLLAGAFYNKETSLQSANEMQLPQIGLRFRSLVALSGLFDLKFTSSMVETAVRHYIMKHVPAKQHYTCYNVKIPMLVICARSDFLIAQSVRFCKSAAPNVQYKIFDVNHLPHAFCQFINLPETQESLDLVIKFIKKLDA